jgi:hypothetical protein
MLARCRGRPRRPFGTPRGGQRRGDWESAEDTPASAVMNPGDYSWTVMRRSIPSKLEQEPWGGAIRQKTDIFSDYTGWEDRSEVLPIEKILAGTKFDILITAKVKGHIKGSEDAVYIRDASVKASPPEDLRAENRRKFAVDVEVGYKDDKKKWQLVKASWDHDKGCARLVIPVRITYRGSKLWPDEFTITWFGNGDAPIHPFSASP